eukprot:2714306-Lingulodinium_polyedra.AAC.1
MDWPPADTAANFLPHASNLAARKTPGGGRHGQLEIGIVVGGGCANEDALLNCDRVGGQRSVNLASIRRM